MWNGPDRCCRTCRTWSEWWYWFCRRTGLPKTPACTSLKPILEPSFSFRLPIYITVILLLRDFSNFGLQKRGSHIVSPRLAALSWAEFSFRKIRVCCLAREMVMVSWLRICDCNDALLRAFLFYFFGFYNFIWRTPLLAIVILFGFSWMRGLINAWI